MAMWTEWEYGIGGRKPAKSWTKTERGAGGNNSVKQMYYRRKNVWRIQRHLVNKGYNIQAANKLIEDTYGANQSITAISEAIASDRKRYKNEGGLHPNLR